MRFVLALGHDRNYPQVWLSEPLMTAEQEAGIPLLGHLGVSSSLSANQSDIPRHRSYLAKEARHPPSSRKNHDGSLARMLNSQIFGNSKRSTAGEDSK